MTDPDDFWHADDRRSRIDLTVLAVAVVLSGGLVAGVLFLVWKLLP